MSKQQSKTSPLHHRPDLKLIAGLVKNHSKVLDVGCGDGVLLDYLSHAKHVDGRGIELSPQDVSQCVARGLSVVQGNADADLSYYPDRAFDYAILGVALQMMQHPKTVLEQLARISDRVIVSIPNFGYWRNRLHLLFKGKMPVTNQLSYSWYETPNIHFCTIKDFMALACELELEIEKKYALDATGHVSLLRGGIGANMMCDKAVFLLKRG